MSQFHGEVEEQFVVPHPCERVVAHFGDLEQLAASQGEALEVVRDDETTLGIVLKPKSAQGQTFQGRYHVRYSRPAPGVLEWTTVGEGNMRIAGRARFFAEGEQTRVQWQERIETEIPVGRLLGAVIGPIVKHEIRRGIKSTIGEMCRRLG